MVPLWYREGGIVVVETRDSLAESQVAARRVVETLDRATNRDRRDERFIYCISSWGPTEVEACH